MINAPGGKRRSAGYILTNENLIALAMSESLPDWIGLNPQEIWERPLPEVLPELCEETERIKLLIHRPGYLFTIPTIHRRQTSSEFGRYFEVQIEAIPPLSYIMVTIVESTEEEWLRYQLNHGVPTNGQG